MLRRHTKKYFIDQLRTMKNIRNSIKEAIEETKESMEENSAKYLYMHYANLVDIDSIIYMTIEYINMYEKMNGFNDVRMLKTMLKAYTEISKRSNKMMRGLFD